MLAFALIGPYILDYSQSFFSLFLHEIGGGGSQYTGVNFLVWLKFMQNSGVALYIKSSYARGHTVVL